MLCDFYALKRQRAIHKENHPLHLERIALGIFFGGSVDPGNYYLNSHPYFLEAKAILDVARILHSVANCEWDVALWASISAYQFVVSFGASLKSNSVCFDANSKDFHQACLRFWEQEFRDDLA